MREVLTHQLAVAEGVSRVEEMSHLLMCERAICAEVRVELEEERSIRMSTEVRLEVVEVALKSSQAETVLAMEEGAAKVGEMEVRLRGCEASVGEKDAELAKMRDVLAYINRYLLTPMAPISSLLWFLSTVLTPMVPN